MTGLLSEQIRGSEAVLMLPPLTRLRLQLLARSPQLGTTESYASAGLHWNHSLQ